MNNPMAAALAEKAEFSDADRLVARHLYGLSALSQRRLDAKELECFLADSYELLNKITEK